MKLIALIAMAMALSSCSLAGYGPEVDYSHFVSVKTSGDGKTFLFTCQKLKYRPAVGWRAFPDGGIPLYTSDKVVLGEYDIPSGKSKVLIERANESWQHGQGEFFISQAKGWNAVIAESGQRRTDYISDSKFYMLDLHTKRLTPMLLKEDFSARGRGVGYFYLYEDGTLLFVNQPLSSPNAKDLSTSELWLRRPTGVYTKVASGSDYYGYKNGEIIYWSPAVRKTFAYNIGTGSLIETRFIPEPEPGPMEEVRISSDTKSLELWKKDGDSWAVERTLLSVRDL